VPQDCFAIPFEPAVGYRVIVERPQRRDDTIQNPAMYRSYVFDARNEPLNVCPKNIEVTAGSCPVSSRMMPWPAIIHGIPNLT